MSNLAKMNADAKYTSGRHSLLAIIVFSFINLFSITFGETYFLFSSYVTQFLAGLSRVFYVEYGQILLTVIFILLGIASLIPYLLLWFFSKNRPGCMIAALVLFSLDSVFFLIDFISLLAMGEFSFVFDLLIRAWALGSLIMAVKNGLESKKLQSMAPEAPAPLNVDAAVWDGEMTARRITVSRKKSFVGMATKFNCLVDGQPVFVLKNGENAEFTVDGNAHELVIKVSGSLVMGGITIPAGTQSKAYAAAFKSGFFTNTIAITEVFQNPPVN